MKDTLRLKVWAGPLTIGSFAVMAGTGVLMFFHLSGGALKLAHEWLGWLMVIGGIAHLAVNWRPLVAYFRKPVSVTIIAVVCMLGLVSRAPLGGFERRPPFFNVAKALEQSSLSTVAQVAKRSPQATIDELTAKGFQVQSADQTIAEIAAENDRSSMEALACALGDASGPIGELPQR
jgi:hypothetical protein